MFRRFARKTLRYLADWSQSRSAFAGKMPNWRLGLALHTLAKDLSFAFPKS